MMSHQAPRGGYDRYADEADAQRAFDEYRPEDEQRAATAAAPYAAHQQHYQYGALYNGGYAGSHVEHGGYAEQSAPYW